MNGHSNGAAIGGAPQSFYQGNRGTNRSSSSPNAGMDAQSSSRGNRVRFPPETDEDNGSVLALLLDLLTAMVTYICIAGLSTILVVLYVTVRPFSKPVYRRLAAQLGASSFLDALALMLPNTKIYLTGDSDVPSPVGASLMVSNHLVDGDWWAILMLGRCVGLRGSIKIFLRNDYLHVNVENNQKPSSGDHQQHLTQSSSSTFNVSSSASIVSTANSGGSTAATHASTTSGSASGCHPGSSSTPSPTGSGVSASFNDSTGPQDLAILAKLLHLFLEFPLMNGEDYSSNRNQMFHLLRSFASESSDGAPVHLLFFPEGWCLHNQQCNNNNRESVLAKSNEFAQREGRPQLKHLLLPRIRGFNATLECLRESNPVVYDVTMANKGYTGSLPPSVKLSSITLWKILRRQFPKEIHIRIKRHTMEEVLQDSSWLDKKWAEKDRNLSYFARHESFPVDNRCYRRPRCFDSLHYSLESSIVALIRLVLIPFFVPLLLLLSVPMFWTLIWIWLANKAFRLAFSVPDDDSPASDDGRRSAGADQTPGSNSGTPYVPSTPFASPSLTNWREMFSNNPSSS